MHARINVSIFRTTLIALLVVLAGCSVSTADLSDASTSKDEAGTAKTAVFEPMDQIFAKVSARHLPGAVKVTWRFFVAKVEGQQDNSAIEEFERTFELPSDGTSAYHLSPPATGWPTGSYRIEIRMTSEGGNDQDLKVLPITVQAPK